MGLWKEARTGGSRRDARFLFMQPKIEGAAEFYKVVKEVSIKIDDDKFIRGAFRQAAKPMLSKIRSGAPSDTGDTRRGPSIRDWKGKRVVVGYSTKGWNKTKNKIIYSKKVNTDGTRKELRMTSEMPAYMKAYWHAYGTLSNRDPGHQFWNPRRGKSALYKGGIKPIGFYEAAVKNSVEISNKISERIFTEGIIDTAKKYAKTTA